MLATLWRLGSGLLPRRGGGEPATDDQTWRLRAAFGHANSAGDVLERLRGRDEILGSEVGGLLPFGVELSRNDRVLLAYASTRSGIDGARRVIEGVLHAAGLSADVCLSRWDEDVGAWRQVDPPLAGSERELDEARAREAMRYETRELSFLVAWTDRALVEGLVLDLARSRDLDCAVEVKQRLLFVRLTFSVGGPALKLDQFVDEARSVVGGHIWSPGTGG
jgi:hypothetical protein